MPNEKEVKKTRTPRTADSITAGALALPLSQRAELCKALKTSIQEEIARLKNDADAAAKLSDNL